MFWILSWAIYGLIVGTIAKLLHSGKDPSGCLPTIMIGVGGSFIGGALNWALGYGTTPFAASGIFMGIVGGIICCYLYSMYLAKQGTDE